MYDFCVVGAVCSHVSLCGGGASDVTGEDGEGAVGAVGIESGLPAEEETGQVQHSLSNQSRDTQNALRRTHPPDRLREPPTRYLVDHQYTTPYVYLQEPLLLGD